MIDGPLSYIVFRHCFFLRGKGPPQQMLRAHRSLKASCATRDEDEQFFLTKFYN
jgi:hypothetical protein